MNLATTRAHLVSLVSGISALTIYPDVPGRPVVPALVIAPEPFDPHAALDATSEDIRFRLQLLVQWSDFETAQAELDSYLSSGPTSVIDALETDKTVAVERVDTYRTLTLDSGETTYGSVDLHVLVML